MLLYITQAQQMELLCQRPLVSTKVFVVSVSSVTPALAVIAGRGKPEKSWKNTDSRDYGERHSVIITRKEFHLKPSICSWPVLLVKLKLQFRESQMI